MRIFAVPIGGHEPEGGIDGIVHDRSVDAIALDDRLPDMNAGAAQRIDADLHARGADGLHIDDVVQIGGVGVDIIMPLYAIATARPP